MANTPRTVETELDLVTIHEGIGLFLEGIVRVAVYLTDEQELAAAQLVQDVMEGPYNTGVELLEETTDFRPHTHNIPEMIREEQERRIREDG